MSKYSWMGVLVAAVMTAGLGMSALGQAPGTGGPAAEEPAAPPAAPPPAVAPAPAPAAEPPAAAPAAAPVTAARPGLELSAEAKRAEEAAAAKNNLAFWTVVRSSGVFGILDWVGLLGTLIGTIWFVVDCGITIREKKIVPQALINKVSEAMAQGDVLKALKSCEEEPGPMANILTSGFTHVEEGFDTIQEAVGVSADLESEKLMQRINYLNVMSNLAPMLGLLGTVQGMIWAFATLALQGGAVQTSLLALSIAQALYTTAAGLCIAIPAIAFFYIYRNAANKMILRMEAMTLELIKDLRNVEVVAE